MGVLTSVGGDTATKGGAEDGSPKWSVISGKHRVNSGVLRHCLFPSGLGKGGKGGQKKETGPTWTSRGADSRLLSILLSGRDQHAVAGPISL